MSFYLAGQPLGFAGLLLVVPTMLRCLPDCRRSWQLRWSRSSEVRPDLVASLRIGRPASTPARAREVLVYVAIMRRGLAVLRSGVYRLAGVLFTLNGLLLLVNSIRLSSPALVPSALILATYPLWTWVYTVVLVKKLDRAELANEDLACRPELYLVRPVGLDVISN